MFWSALIIPISWGYHTIKEASGKPNYEDQSALLNIISRIVGEKAERFVKQVKTVEGKESVQAATVFKNITQPINQMEEIVAGVWHFFAYAVGNRDVEIRVALARMGKEHITKFECFHPSDRRPRSNPESLWDHRSGFSTAKRERKMIIIEDFRAEQTKGKSARFLVTNQELRDEEGSMICYPVIADGLDRSVPYVISVWAGQKYHFLESYADAYENILTHFSKRIVLEYCLKTLKEKAK